MLIDAHAHLDKYGDLLGRALQDIREQRIFTVATAMDLPSYHESIRIAQQSELVLATFGIHPRRAPEYASRLAEIAKFIEQSPAIGEIGLDFHWIEDSSQYPAQLKVLEYFLAAAREQKKFVNLHTKGGEKQIIDLLEHYGVERAIIHWYSGPLDVLRAMIQFGACFTVGVEIMYSDTIRAIAREIPDHLLLTETDNPGGLKWLNGIVGMPGEISRVVDELARVRGNSAQSVAQLVDANFRRFIDGDPWLAEIREGFNQA